MWPLQYGTRRTESALSSTTSNPPPKTRACAASVPVPVCTYLSSAGCFPLSDYIINCAPYRPPAWLIGRCNPSILLSILLHSAITQLAPFITKHHRRCCCSSGDSHQQCCVLGWASGLRIPQQRQDGSTGTTNLLLWHCHLCSVIGQRCDEAFIKGCAHLHSPASGGPFGPCSPRSLGLGWTKVHTKYEIYPYISIHKALGVGSQEHDAVNWGFTGSTVRFDVYSRIIEKTWLRT